MKSGDTVGVMCWKGDFEEGTEGKIGVLSWRTINQTEDFKVDCVHELPGEVRGLAPSLLDL